MVCSISVFWGFLTFRPIIFGKMSGPEIFTPDPVTAGRMSARINVQACDYFLFTRRADGFYSLLIVFRFRNNKRLMHVRVKKKINNNSYVRRRRLNVCAHSPREWIRTNGQKQTGEEKKKTVTGRHLDPYTRIEKKNFKKYIITIIIKSFFHVCVFNIKKKRSEIVETFVIFKLFFFSSVAFYSDFVRRTKLFHPISEGLTQSYLPANPG